MNQHAVLIRDIPDFPKPGVVFKDITPLLRDAAALRDVIAALADTVRGERIDAVAAIESRGFIFGAALATGGTLVAARELIKAVGGELVAATVVIELAFLDGRRRWGDGAPLHALWRY